MNSKVVLKKRTQSDMKRAKAKTTLNFVGFVDVKGSEDIWVKFLYCFLFFFILMGVGIDMLYV